MAEKTGYIYVLTNKSFHMDNWIKIGYAEDVEKRVRELSNTSVPLPYETYCTYEIPRIEGVKDPDKLLHDLINMLNPDLRISPNREFFVMAPWEAYNMLFAIAQMHGREGKLVRNNNNIVEDVQLENEYTVEALFPSKTEVGKLYNTLRDIVLGINSNLEEFATRQYVTFKVRKKKNTVSMWPKNGWVEVILNAKLGQLNDNHGLIYDISNRKWSAAQYAFKFYPDTDIKAVKDIIEQTIKLIK